MFFQVASQALGTILTWQFWVVAVGSTIIVALGYGLVGAALAAPRVGSVLGWIAIPVMWLLPSVVVTVGIILLIPVMLLWADYLGLHLLPTLGLVDFLKVYGAAFLGALVVAFVPILGRATSVISVVQAVIVMSLSITLISEGNIRVWPDIWTALLMALSIAVGTWLLVMLLSWPLAVIAGGGEAAGQLLGLVFGSAVTYFAAAVYGGWIRVDGGM